MLLRCCVLLLLLLPALPAAADPRPAQLKPLPELYLIYTWQETLYAQSVQNPADVQVLGADFPGAAAVLAPWHLDRYERSLTPLPPSLAVDYGFFHGLWQAGGTRFAYLELAQGSPESRVMLWENGESRELLSRSADAQRGILDPLTWTADGQLLLLERHMMQHLEGLRVWQLNPADGTLLPYANASLAQNAGYQLRGRVFSLGGQVFLGYTLEDSQLYFFDVETRQVTALPMPLPPLEKEPPVFDRLPYRVLGLLPGPELNTAAEALFNALGQPAFAVLNPMPAPFLYWFLGDSFRRVTCYPDSTWTRSHFNVTCPELGVMYEGHQGTDVSGPRSGGGLPIGTPVYAAAPGWVVQVLNNCGINAPSCGRAYGNYVLMEHVRVVEGQAQVWTTGYAHLSRALVAPYHFVSDLTQPIAESGSTGTGGPHVHFELRCPYCFGAMTWVDPWDSTRTGASLWVGGAHPQALVP